jgi:hypothetical protein
MVRDAIIACSRDPMYIQHQDKLGGLYSLPLMTNDAIVFCNSK